MRSLLIRRALRCADIVNSGNRQIEIVGPLLPQEGLAAFDGYQFSTKMERHRLRRPTD